jgi:hypothetical protein
LLNMERLAENAASCVVVLVILNITGGRYGNEKDSG